MVYVIFVCQLQYHLQNIGEKLESAASGQSRVFAREPMATGLVSQRFRLLSTLHERDESRGKTRKTNQRK